MMNKPTLLILAAGMGSRYGGDKQIDGFGPNKETILEYSVFDAIRSGFGKVVFIVRKEILEEAKALFVPKFGSHIKLDFVVQALDTRVPAEYRDPERKKPYGTAHALLCAKDAVREPFAVINADDFYGEDAFRILARFLTKEVRADLHCMVGYAIKNVLSENGTVSRGVCESSAEGYLKGMVERTSIARTAEGIFHQEGDERIKILPENPVSMNCWGFHPAVFEQTEKLWFPFLEESRGNLKSEFYIPKVVNSLIQEDMAKVKILEGGRIWFGVTYPEDRAHVMSSLKKLHQEGVYPEKLW
ncbi:MobA-like NTP transferase domain-containing protein [Cyclobacterium lianum]|uniref:MobA-like NTP transferase domain-containing protein n=1 Tax=Cyclobacterium lianum TaxID=388280 RepID=A0A1M7JTE8_9BACT|nr:sugar phosphate nucleotidyltransferase [Cyclobacterium lianum]SHM56302.1 MobA-like NTP transferase domain-containing protein [Cyclobacterium lianum]